MKSGKSNTPIYESPLRQYIPKAMIELIGSKGVDVVKRVGVDVVKGVIADVLCGVNLRDSTEVLTRRRIGMVNAATLAFFVRGISDSRRFLEKLPLAAAEGLKRRPPKHERWLFQWILGLTGKGVQNVLRDSEHALDHYSNRFIETSKEIVERCQAEYGPVAGKLALGKGGEVKVGWDFLLELFCTIGSQTLAIRGSEKSTYGKLFERLILGSVLQILGFKMVDYPPSETKKVFWLSSKLGTRESDATVLLRPGKAIRFDIGFIGRGNPEISKDKVSRFEREIEIESVKYYAATFIVVDRIGEQSKIVEQAKAIDGTIIQMSLSYWPLQLAQKLRERFGYKHEICDLSGAQLETYLRKKVEQLQIQGLVEKMSELIAQEGSEANESEA